MVSQPTHLNPWFKVSGLVAAYTEGTFHQFFPLLMLDQPVAQTKSELRRNIRLQRQQISVRQRSVLDQAINRALLEYARIHEITSVAAFWPFDGEPDLRPALRGLESSKIAISLPVLHKDTRPPMSMHRWCSQSTMMENSFHIPEPVNEPRVPVRGIELLIIPLVAWDRNRGRLSNHP